MKSFITSSITLLLLITAIIFNSHFLTLKAEHILKQIEQLPPSTAECDISSVTKEWRRCRNWVAISVSRKKIDEIDDTIQLLENYVLYRNDSAYISCRESLICLFERLRETESFSLGRIF